MSHTRNPGSGPRWLRPSDSFMGGWRKRRLRCEELAMLVGGLSRRGLCGSLRSDRGLSDACRRGAEEAGARTHPGAEVLGREAPRHGSSSPPLRRPAPEGQVRREDSAPAQGPAVWKTRGSVPKPLSAPQAPWPARTGRGELRRFWRRAVSRLCSQGRGGCAVTSVCVPSWSPPRSTHGLPAAVTHEQDVRAARLLVPRGVADTGPGRAGAAAAAACNTLLGTFQRPGLPRVGRCGLFHCYRLVRTRRLPPSLLHERQGFLSRPSDLGEAGSGPTRVSRSCSVWECGFPVSLGGVTHCFLNPFLPQALSPRLPGPLRPLH